MGSTRGIRVTLEGISEGVWRVGTCSPIKNDLFCDTRNTSGILSTKYKRDGGPLQGYFYQISKGGHLRFWTFFDKFWTFFERLDLSLWHVDERSRYLTKDPELWNFFVRCWVQRVS